MMAYDGKAEAAQFCFEKAAVRYAKNKWKDILRLLFGCLF